MVKEALTMEENTKIRLQMTIIKKENKHTFFDEM
jgi:hypothetical protein